MRKLHAHSDIVMATKAEPSVFAEVKENIPEARYEKLARIILLGKPPEKINNNTILIMSAGTADIPIADEAAVTAEVMGNKVERLYDVGVAGAHRLLQNKEKLFNAQIIIVVAGMEGALASMVGGMVDKPVIAVPTSIGYGASFQGLSALLTMLNSCATGVVVVNIDNGFGAATFASIINHKEETP